jgi:quinol monooxygenase YgiN
MSVTVVGRWHVPVGREDQVVAAARQELVARAGLPRARRNAQVFQATDDLGALLYVGEWTDRAAFEQYRVEAEAGDAIRELLMPNGRWAKPPGLVHSAVYREITHSHRYVIVHGWQSERALLAMRDGRRELQAVLDTFGGSVIQFSGYERTSTDLL